MFYIFGNDKKNYRQGERHIHDMCSTKQEAEESLNFLRGNKKTKHTTLYIKELVEKKESDIVSEAAAEIEDEINKALGGHDAEYKSLWEKLCEFYKVYKASKPVDKA